MFSGMRTLTTIVTLSILTLTACKSDDDGPTPVEQCEAFIDTICDREVECYSGTVRADCIAQIETTIDCGDAVDVSDDYPRCIDALNDLTCPQWTATTALPASCNAVILVDQ